MNNGRATIKPQIAAQNRPQIADPPATNSDTPPNSAASELASRA